MRYQTVSTAAVCALGLILWSGAAPAIPALQLYVEGAAYDTDTQTWIVETDFSAPLRLWTVGNTGGVGTIYDAKLAVAYDAGSTPTFDITAATTGGTGGFTDASIPSAPAWVQTSTAGDTPLMGDGDPLPNHGEYGAGTWWQEFSLGDFSLTDSPIADFVDSFPTPSAQWGQINVYEIMITGAEWLHFDLYDHYLSRTRAVYKFAPFSHDAGGTTVPEPTPIALIGVGLLVLGLVRLRRGKTH